MRRQLSSGLPPDAVWGDKLFTQWAIKSRKMNILKVLLQSGADVNKVNRQGENALYYAVAKMNSEVVNLLLEQDDILPDLKTGHGTTPLHLACYKGSHKIAALLLNKNADVNAQDNGGHSPLYLAVQENHPDVVRLLLDQDGVIVDLKNNEGVAPVQRACYDSYQNIVALLLSKGANVNTQNNGGFSPLLDAVEQNHPDLVQLLLDQDDILVDLKTNKGWTPLFKACYKGYRNIALLLLNKGADVNAQNDEGYGPLHVAVERKHPAVVELLLDQDSIIVDLKNNEGITALQTACYEGNQVITALLLNKGADVNSQDSEGFSLLFSAVQQNHINLVKLLLDQIGIQVDLQQKSHGYSPLHKAAADGNIVMITLLVGQGKASTSLKNWKGDTPIQLARKKNHFKAANLMESFG